MPNRIRRLPGSTPRTATAIALLAGLLLGSAWARALETRRVDEHQPRQGVSPEMVEWLLPARPTNEPQTDEQKALARTHGRNLPEPELLQPTLDPALGAYQPRAGAALSGGFECAASDVLPSLVARWIDAFQRRHPEVEIELSPPYAGSLGAKELIAGNVDVAFVSRELRPDDVSEFEARYGYPPLSVPISGGSYRHYGFLDAIAFFVHKQNPLESISFEQLDAIFSSTRHRGGGSITTWGQLGLTGEWAERAVNAYGIQPWNGFEEFVRQRVLDHGGRRGEWRSDVRFDKVVFPIATRVAKDPHGIGYSGLAFSDAGVRMLAVAEVEGGPYHAPTYENVARARYPLRRLIYFNTNRPPSSPLDPVIEALLRFILSRDGQQIVLDHAIYLPLRAPQVEASRALLH